MNNRPLGFNKDNLVQIGRLGVLKDSGKLQLFKSELIKSGAIVSATETTNGLTNNYVSTEKIKWPGQQKNEQVAMQLRFSGYNFTKTIGAKILEGRDFSREFGNDTTKVILNETAVKTMNLKDPLGARIKNDDWNETFTVIGVMKDYNYSSLGTKVSPLLFFYSETNPGTIIMRLNPSQSITASVQRIKELSLKLNPDYPFQMDFVSERVADKLKSEKLLSVFSNVFGGFAIFISCLGLLGLALYIAEQRSKEISIRKVIGASLKDILILLNKDFIKLVILSNMIATPAAYVITANWLQKYDYKIGLNIWPFIIAFVLSIFIAVLTVSLQTFKVARANPVDALKYD
jgi:ABC-type antimicrobial peptide transport system permease subunit